MSTSDWDVTTVRKSLLCWCRFGQIAVLAIACVTTLDLNEFHSLKYIITHNVLWHSHRICVLRITSFGWMWMYLYVYMHEWSLGRRMVVDNTNRTNQRYIIQKVEDTSDLNGTSLKHLNIIKHIHSSLCSYTVHTHFAKVIETERGKIKMPTNDAETYKMKVQSTVACTSVQNHRHFWV